MTTSPLQHVYSLFLEAAQEGFDWDSPFEAAQKVYEEMDEILEELKKPSSSSQQKALKEEIGDLFCACVSVAQQCGIDPEEAIAISFEKFKKRYRYFKVLAQEKGVSLQQASSSELNALWQEVKKQLSSGS